MFGQRTQRLKAFGPYSSTASGRLAEGKVDVLHAMVRPSVKALAASMAEADRRSLAQWLEVMIEDEATRRAAKGSKKP
jgi:predicted HicB family RNase H-like nuclease